jgi:tRNA(Arg) A34 adenosine deaminase TadA
MNKVLDYYSRPFANPYTVYSHDEEPLSNNDLSFLAATAKIAATSEYRFRIAAMLVKNGRVFGADVNMFKITPSTPPNRLSTHAEVRVIKNTKHTAGATLYVARLRNNGTTSMAKPCAWCMSTLLDAGINKVVFTTDRCNPLNETNATGFYMSSVQWDHNCNPYAPQNN